MGWVAPVAAATSAVLSVSAARQASANGQESEMTEKQNEFDIARFDQQFYELQGETKTAILTSGVELSGSGLRVLRYNAEQAEIEKDITTYNNYYENLARLEKANFARMQGQVAKNEARAAELGYYAKAGESLMKQYG